MSQRGENMPPPGLRQRLARGVVWLRWPIVAFWVLAAVMLTGFAPTSQTAGTGLDALLPEDSPAAAAEARSYEQFDLPLLSRLAVVQRAPDGLDAEQVATTVAAAARLDAQRLQEGFDPQRDDLLAALPLVNSTSALPTSTGDGTTAITYLFGSPQATAGAQTRAAESYAEQLGPDADVVGVTGPIAAQREQGRIISERLPWVEFGTVAFVLLVVGIAFRSVLAPLVTVGTARLAYRVSVRVLGLVGTVSDVAVPPQREPLFLALLVGVVADYSIFYLYAARSRLREGLSPRAAALGSTASYSSVILAAGLTVAAGTASLLVARLPLYSSFGPGLALTVLTGLVISLTLIPALMAILGRALFWPARFPATVGQRGRAPRTVTASGAAPKGPGRLVRALTRRPVAVLAVLVCVAGLGLAASPVRDLRLDLSFTGGLPASDPVSRAQEAAAAGFAPGIVSPTVLVVDEPGVTQDRRALAVLQDEVEQVPGVAGVVGPGQVGGDRALGVLLSRSGDAARLLLVLDHAPLSATAVDVVEDLQDRLPAMLSRAGLPQGSATVTGDSAVAAELVSATGEDFLRIAVTASLVLLALLVVVLRALVAPLFLLASSLLSVAAALGISTWVFQDLLGRDGLTFYVPFATTVLSLALGSDYNVFSVGRIWQVAKDRSLREAVRVVTPRTNAAIRTAGIALAGSLALVALVPLWPFQEIALTMAVGLLLDVFVVRSFLVPSLITVFGPLSRWPGRRPSQQLA